MKIQARRKKKIEDLISKHEQEKLEITRALQHKLDEKLAKITKYESRLQELELNSGKMQKQMEKNF